MEEALAKGVQLFLALSAGYLVASWFVLAVWAYRDIGSRSKSVVTQVLGTLLVVLFWIPGALLYLLLRPNDTIDDVYQRSLEEEYLIHDLEEVPVCHSCQRPVEDEYIICPHCQAELKEVCPVCTRLISLQWDICPFCAASREDRAAYVREQLPATVERFIDRGERTIRSLPSSRPVPEVASGQREAISSGIETPSLNSGEHPDSGDVDASEEGPIRLFDRKRTRMRNEHVDLADGETQSTPNGTAAESNGHLSDDHSAETSTADSGQSEGQDEDSEEGASEHSSNSESERAPVSRS